MQFTCFAVLALCLVVGAHASTVSKTDFSRCEADLTPCRVAARAQERFAGMGDRLRCLLLLGAGEYLKKDNVDQKLISVAKIRAWKNKANAQKTWYSKDIDTALRQLLHPGGTTVIVPMTASLPTIKELLHIVRNDQNGDK
ncbi:unnamed protein product [Echinostoma caproni]|uniref:Secreted protein n=1 Tax=Echinostoma caproni TaxID=27848 RepID=A0A183AJH4_9TREM|nr:unnamed protein product [Echinostoma caproni]